MQKSKRGTEQGKASPVYTATFSLQTAGTLREDAPKTKLEIQLDGASKK
jgi:hypothetical protein